MLSATALFAGLLVALYVLGSVLITVLIGALIAYILLPLTNILVRPMPWRESRPGLSRGIAVGFIFIVAAGVVAGLMALVVPPTIDQGRAFIEDFPTFFNQARVTVERWIGDYADLVPDEFRGKIEENIANMGEILADAAWEVLPSSINLISETFSLIIGLATLPVLVFYMVKDAREIGPTLIKPFPTPLRPYLIDLAKIADKTLGGYLRGQLILGLSVGVAVAIGLTAMGVPFAFVLGIVAGISEMIPIVGPLIGGAAGILVTLATAPEKVIWVALLYLGVQLLENTLLVPRVQAHTLNLHPIAIIIVIIVGSHFFGIWGIILGAPLVSMARDIARYLGDEWDRPPNHDAISEDEEENSSVENKGTETNPQSTE